VASFQVNQSGSMVDGRKGLPKVSGKAGTMRRSVLAGCQESAEESEKQQVHREKRIIIKMTMKITRTNVINHLIERPLSIAEMHSRQ
jgi:hypothetical protein